MSWLFSLEMVAEFSEATSSAGGPFAPLSVMPTPHRFSRNDKTIEPSQLSRFGLTCAVLTADHGAALLTWYRAGFLARTSQLQELVPASTAAAPVCGEKWHESSVKYDLAGCCWRTHRCLWEEALPWSSVTLPAWGMTCAGVVYQRQNAAPHTNATESGLWPTPTVHGNHNQPGSSKNAGWGLSSAAKQWPGAQTRPANRRRRSSSIAHPWPTPVASMSKGSSPNALTRRSGASRARDRLDHAVMASDHGHLNPTWVEWLMGWPTGWTDLKPLAMDKFHEWQLQHSMCCTGKNDKEAA
jgi:hypothetical protein